MTFLLEDSSDDPSNDVSIETMLLRKVEKRGYLLLERFKLFNKNEILPANRLGYE